jgi:hypothetical protein
VLLSSVGCRPHHDLPKQHPWRPVRDGVRLRRLPLRIDAGARLLPRLPHRVQVRVEVRRDRVVRHVRALMRDLHLLDVPEDVAAELAIVPLADRIATTPVDVEANLHASDRLVERRRAPVARVDMHVRHAEERIVPPAVPHRRRASLLR